MTALGYLPLCAVLAGMGTAAPKKTPVFSPGSSLTGYHTVVPRLISKVQAEWDVQLGDMRGFDSQGEFKGQRSSPDSESRAWGH